jgi:hypothetical protein
VNRLFSNTTKVNVYTATPPKWIVYTATPPKWILYMCFHCQCNLWQWTSVLECHINNNLVLPVS